MHVLPDYVPQSIMKFYTLVNAFTVLNVPPILEQRILTPVTEFKVLLQVVVVVEQSIIG